MMAHGSFVLMLHTHLPYYRQAGMWPFGEENLYECWAEVYVPLVQLLRKLHQEGVPVRVTLGITPVLLEQLNDEYLKAGFVTYLTNQHQRALADVQRFSAENQPELATLAQYQVDRFAGVTTAFAKGLQSDMIGALRQLQDDGVVELVASAATHALLPLLRSEASLNAQIKGGIQVFEQYFGTRPLGFWLPECGYRPAQHRHGQLWPSLETYLAREGIRYTFTEYHAIEGASSSENIFRNPGMMPGSTGTEPNTLPQASRDTLFEVGTQEAYALADSSVAVLARNNEASFQVWSASYGYPGDGDYQEFHKTDDVSGLRYWRLTAKSCDLGNKALYNPATAQAKALEHAAHFVSLVEQAVASAPNSDQPVLVHTSFDTELFGHWWHEGLTWLEAVLRGMAQATTVDMHAASEYLDQCPPRHSVRLPESTWGEGGHFWVWQNGQTDFIWQGIEAADRRLSQWMSAATHQALTPFQQAAIAQAARELMLMQASDWPFLITTHQAKDYATGRFKDHLANFNQLLDCLESNTTDETALARIAGKDNLFASLNPSQYWASQPVSTAASVG
jgi:1,4-alpha-glucan branching enzyme